MKSTRRAMGHSLLRSLVRSHRSLICLLRADCFARALHCAHSLIRSPTYSFQISWALIEMQQRIRKKKHFAICNDVNSQFSPGIIITHVEYLAWQRWRGKESHRPSRREPFCECTSGVGPKSLIESVPKFVKDCQQFVSLNGLRKKQWGTWWWVIWCLELNAIVISKLLYTFIIPIIHIYMI